MYWAHVKMPERTSTRVHLGILCTISQDRDHYNKPLGLEIPTVITPHARES